MGVRWSEDDLRRHRNSSDLERTVQKGVVDWAEAQSGTRGALGLLYAVPNGQVRPGEAQEPGLSPGVPDLVLPVPREPYASLYLELKREDGVPSDVSEDQTAWLRALSAAGNAAVVAFGFEQARTVLLLYLNGRLDSYINETPALTPYA